MSCAQLKKVTIVTVRYISTFSFTSFEGHGGSGWGAEVRLSLIFLFFPSLDDAGEWLRILAPGNPNLTSVSLQLILHISSLFCSQSNMIFRFLLLMSNNPLSASLSVARDVSELLVQVPYLVDGAYDYKIPNTPPVYALDGQFLPPMPGSPLSDISEPSPAVPPSNAMEDVPLFDLDAMSPLPMSASSSTSTTKKRPHPDSDAAASSSLNSTKSATKHNKKRGHLNRAKKRKVQASGGRIIDNVGRDRHVQTSETITVPTDTANSSVAETGYLGLLGNDTRKKEYLLPELCGKNSRFQMQYVPYTGPCVLLLLLVQCTDF